MILILTIPGFAFALEEDHDFDREGFYIGAGAFGAWFRESDDAFEEEVGLRKSRILKDPYVKADTDYMSGADVRIGYRLNPHFAVEIESHINPSTTVTIKHRETDPNDTSQTVDVKSTVSLETVNVTANLKYFVLTDRIQPFFLVGVGIANYEIQDDAGLLTSDAGTGVAWRFATGVDYYLTRNILVALDANYIHPKASVKDYDYISIGLGLQYRF
jgi:opacity protein-like surface antigen